MKTSVKLGASGYKDIREGKVWVGGDVVLCFHVGVSRSHGKTRGNANLISEISFTIRSSVLIARYITGD